MFGSGLRGGVFEDTYRCFSVAIAGRSELEGGDKIVLPPSALQALLSLEVKYPMMFRIANEVTGEYTHVGVMDFDAEERRCFIPAWIMRMLGIPEEGLVRITNVRLDRANFVQFRPQTSDFTTKLLNPKAFLEGSLKKFSCLTKGQSISVEHPKLGVSFVLDVLELKPKVRKREGMMGYESGVGG